LKYVVIIIAILLSGCSLRNPSLDTWFNVKAEVVGLAETHEQFKTHSELLIQVDYRIIEPQCLQGRTTTICYEVGLTETNVKVGNIVTIEIQEDWLDVQEE
jgi:hypothetical protein